MCKERPEIERYHVGVVIPAFIGHTLVLLDKNFRQQAQGIMDWENGRLITQGDGYKDSEVVSEGWYLVHHPERCNG